MKLLRNQNTESSIFVKVEIHIFPTYIVALILKRLKLKRENVGLPCSEVKSTRQLLPWLETTCLDKRHSIIGKRYVLISMKVITSPSPCLKKAKKSKSCVISSPSPWKNVQEQIVQEPCSRLLSGSKKLIRMSNKNPNSLFCHFSCQLSSKLVTSPMFCVGRYPLKKWDYKAVDLWDSHLTAWR